MSNNHRAAHRANDGSDALFSDSFEAGDMRRRAGSWSE